MSVRILNVYDNNASPDRDLRSGHGQAMYIIDGDRHILYDTGYIGKDFMHNMRVLNVDPNQIDTLVLSHGHLDHTGGLPALLDARTASAAPLKIEAHPDVRTTRRISGNTDKISFFGFPDLTSEQEDKINWHLTDEPVQVTDHVHTLGEILDRPEPAGNALRLRREMKPGSWELDPNTDDLSLVVKTKEGIVIVCGCCHAGILNVCAAAKDIHNEKIVAVIGGTHMVHFKPDEMERIGDMLVDKYGTPKLYLNHCTGNAQIDQLMERFGTDVVAKFPVSTDVISGFPVGTELIFD